MSSRTALSALVAAAALAACDSPSGTNRDAHLSIQLTDAPVDYLESAVVEIGRIEILPLAGGPAVVIVEDAESYNLLELQNGVTAHLGAADIESGRYGQLRMIVESAVLTLKDGYQFIDGSTTQTLFVPSGMQTGIKINLTTADGDNDAGIDIAPGETVLVVDFDVSQNFVLHGDAETPAGIQSFLFTPTLRAIVRDVAGSIAGSVTAPEGVTVAGLQVSATRSGATEPAATTLVQADGSYLLPYIAPGQYSVTVTVPTGYTTTPLDVTVGEDENVEGKNLAITAE